jgi:thioredoxin reductase (NADPH)
MTNLQNKELENNCDVLIIGAGPAGLFAIFEAGMLKMKCHVVDSLEIIGGQCSALYPEKPIYDIPAHPKVLGSELIELLEAQAQQFNPVYHLNQSVIKIDRQIDDSFIIETSKKTIIKCKVIIIAAGCGAFGPNRPPLKNIEQFEGKSIFYSVRNKSEFVDKKIVIAGGGDSAIDWAINLAVTAKKIYLIHRRDKFRCAPDSLDKLKKLSESGKIEMVIPFQLHGLEGNNGKLSKVIVSDFDNNVKALEADYLLPFFGLAMDIGEIVNWDLNLHKNHIEVDYATMQTSQKNIYAIGDIATYKNKLKLILTGFSEGAIACHDAYKTIFPDQIFHFEYSTSKGINTK